MAVTGTLNGGYGSQFVMENGGSLSAGQLVDYFSSYYVYAGDALTVSGGVNDGTTGLRRQLLYDQRRDVHGRRDVRLDQRRRLRRERRKGPARLVDGGFARERRHALRL